MAEKKNSGIHVVLDMDGTLIDNEGIGVYRPFLQEFLNYCFDEFESVNIWTAAGVEWYDIVHRDVLAPILGEREFGFVWTGRTRCRSRLVSTEGLIPQQINYKDIRDLWRTYDHLHQDNTILIDDLMHTVSWNSGNSIHVPTFKNRISGPDMYLDAAMQQLTGILDDVREGKKLADAIRKSTHGKSVVI